MRILLTNDDSIHADGFRVLEEIAHTLSDDIWSVAPETDRSGLAHSLTQLEPLRVRKYGDKRYSVTGTPADCVIVGVRDLLPEPPDLILSGVNSGANIADDIIYSGTIGGTIEGTLFGVPSIALSQHYDFVDGERVFNWDISRKNAPAIIRKLLSLPRKEGVFYNINFPNCRDEELQAVRVVSQGKRAHGYQVEQRLDGRKFPYYWIHSVHDMAEYEVGSDAEALALKAPSVSALRIDMTDYETNHSLVSLFGS
ncbi:5'/3'-nucleotidase SurE [Shinella zoogloeoides]|uniref:5'/3'-nucleotidase SurE n=1 Tax=Shinella zoogloeoides TaxID=352475 RepID=UPI00299E2504|nr:5'/3'-nucleotidase SurE [Shinella zoogloeoides]WPE23058.1 5'-nucleotidase SurE [Shinella zoogloeoides]